MQCFLHPAIYMADTAGKGRGMFTRQPLAGDTVIEISPVIPIDEAGRSYLRATLLKNYIFGWEGESCCVALGYASIYNHAYIANCTYAKDIEAQTISIRTVRDVEAGEELCTNYNGVWDDQSPLLWFDVQ